MSIKKSKILVLYILALVLSVLIILHLICVQKPESNGYVMALGYSDQMTGSLPNLLSMQCWAKSLGPNVRVVEPFIRTSMLGLDFLHLIDTNNMNNKTIKLDSVKLSDVYNRLQWDKFASKYAPLVDWDDFVQNAPRKMIIIDREKTNYSMEEKYGSKEWLNQSIHVLTHKYGFEIVHTAYFHTERTTQRKFRELVYKNYAPQIVTVVFNYWGGINPDDLVYRVGIVDLKQCQRDRQAYSFPLSSQLDYDAYQYTRRYLHHNDGKGYISVMVRIEFFAIKYNKFKGMSKEEILPLLQTFIGKIMEKFKKFKVAYGVNNVFLTTDCWKEGSSYFSTDDIPSTQEVEAMKLMSNSVHKLYTMMYGNSSSLEDWNETFYNVTTFRNSGYIAMLQKNLAARGTCLITAGGGSFQSTARTLYHHYHLGTKCVAAL